MRLFFSKRLRVQKNRKVARSPSRVPKNKGVQPIADRGKQADIRLGSELKAVAGLFERKI
jgi:hypothetical protein